jgi:signal transduction histidine kinase
MVADNGKGFNPDEVLDGDPSRRGLGLMAMKERVRMMGGSLEITSEEGKGTRIAFRIPVGRSQAGTDPEEPGTDCSEALPALSASGRKPPGL